MVTLTEHHGHRSEQQEEGMSRHLTTPFRRGRRKVDLRRRPARAEESGQATKGGQGSGEEQAALEERARSPFRNGGEAH